MFVSRKKLLCIPLQAFHYHNLSRPSAAISSYLYQTPKLTQLSCFTSAPTMSAKTPPLDLLTLAFSSAAEFEAFLEREHATTPGLHLKLAKKSSGIASISAAEAVEVALCFGWIDGRANRLDDDWWTVRYTPRRPKSMWSQKNVGTIGRLLEQGRIRPAGLAAVEAAKVDGRWKRAYAGPASITVPDDFATAVAGDAAAAAFFEGLNKSDRYSVVWRVQTASPKFRTKRIEVLVQTLAAGKVPGGEAKLAGKSRKNTAFQKAVKTTTTVKRQVSSSRQPKSLGTVQDGRVRQPRREGLRRRL
jgi:uncharacterized protein YdeI (YjbR/CyaY-like superfamily)